MDGAAPAEQWLPPWARVATVMFGVGWGANQFSSLLLAYRLHRGVSDSTADALFGVYALGLIPALLVIGPISDQRGRRRIVRGAGVLSVVASLALIAGAHSLGMLYIGRFLAGACSGAAFAAGTAWIKELSVAPYDLLAGEQAAARRAAIGLSAGFGLGPLVAGLLAQWGPDPLLIAYLPHVVVMLVALVTLVGTPETVSSDVRPVSLTSMLRVPSAGHDRFRGIVAPAAPWVFAAPSIALAPAGSARHSATLTTRYCEYIPPPAAATTLPSNLCAAGDPPAATTVPAPSLPTGMAVPTRPARPGMAASGMGAVTTGRSADPLAAAAVISAPPNSRPMSDGLIGAASTLMTTSSGPGSGTGTTSRNSSRV